MLILGIILPGGFLIAMSIGFLTGIFGIGGGFLMTPALIIILGMPGPVAVGTGLAMILATSSFATLRRRRTGTVDVKLALTIAAGGILGIAIGLYILESLKRTPPLFINGRELDAAEYVLLCAFTILLTLVTVYLYLDDRRRGGRPSERRVGVLVRVKVPPYYNYPSLEEPRLSVVSLVLLGIGVGVLTGLMGLGGGVILLPILIYVVGQRAAKAAGTSLLIVWILSLVAVALNGGCGNIHIPLWGAMTAGGIVGVYFGTKMGLRATEARLQHCFIFVLLTALSLVGCKVVYMTFG